MEAQVTESMDHWQKDVKDTLSGMFMPKEEWVHVQKAEANGIAWLRGELIQIRRELAEQQIQVDHRLKELGSK